MTMTSADWKRFVANMPESAREYRTLELWHPQFSTVTRFVSNSCDVQFGIEQGAPRDPGDMVNFRAITVDIVEPAEREDSEQVLQVNAGTVDGTVQELARQIKGLGYFTPVEVIYRKYYSSDLTKPATPPLYLFANNLVFNGPETARFTAADVDLAQKRAGEIYTPQLFPGLRD